MSNAARGAAATTCDQHGRCYKQACRASRWLRQGGEASCEFTSTTLRHVRQSGSAAGRPVNLRAVRVRVVMSFSIFPARPERA
jgi:hypothetical protein